MSSPREAQLPLLLSISEGLSRGTDEMLRVSPEGDAIHPPSCSLAIREAVEEIKWLRAEVVRMTRERDESRAEVERLRAEKEALYASIAGIERAAAGAIYSQESIHAMALYALKPLMERGIEAVEAKP